MSIPIPSLAPSPGPSALAAATDPKHTGRVLPARADGGNKSNCSLQTPPHSAKAKMVLERTSSRLLKSDYQELTHQGKDGAISSPGKIPSLHFSENPSQTVKVAQGWSYSSTWLSPHTWPGNNFRLGMHYCIQAATPCCASCPTPRPAGG